MVVTQKFWEKRVFEKMRKNLNQSLLKKQAAHAHNAAEILWSLCEIRWILGTESQNLKVFKAWKQIILNCSIVREYPEISNLHFEIIHEDCQMKKKLLF